MIIGENEKVFKHMNCNGCFCLKSKGGEYRSTECVLAKRDNNVNIYMVDMCYISDGIYLTLGYYVSWGEI